MFKLHTARRSAFLSSLETDGRGVRPGIERDQVVYAVEQLNYFWPADYHRLKLMAFQQGPEVEIEVGALAKALVFEDPFWTEEKFSVVVFFGKQWVGEFCGEEIVVGSDPSTVSDGIFPIFVTYSDARKVLWRFDATLLNFLPQYDGDLPCHYSSSETIETSDTEISAALVKARNAAIARRKR